MTDRDEFADRPVFVATWSSRLDFGSQHRPTFEAAKADLLERLHADQLNLATTDAEDDQFDTAIELVASWTGPNLVPFPVAGGDYGVGVTSRSRRLPRERSQPRGIGPICATRRSNP